MPNLPRVTDITSSATPGLNLNETDKLRLTAQAANFVLQNPTGTKREGAIFELEVTPDSTPRNIGFDTDYDISRIADLPTATTASTPINIIFEVCGTTLVCVGWF